MERAGLLHRATALVILLGLLAVAAFFVVKPVRDALRAMDRQLAENASVVQRLLAGSDSIETYEEALASVETAVRGDPRYLLADSPALASAALQRIVREAIEGAGATLRSIQDVSADNPVSEQDMVLSRTSVTVRATVVATYPDILAAIGTLESAKPYLFVDRLSIRSPLRTEPATEWTPLTVQFEVTAYMPPSATLAQ